MVGQLVLVQSIGVRIPVPEQYKKQSIFYGLFFVWFERRRGIRTGRSEANFLPNFCRQKMQLSVARCDPGSIERCPGQRSSSGSESEAEIPVPEQIKTPLFAKGGVFILFMLTILMLPKPSLHQNPIQAFF